MTFDRTGFRRAKEDIAAGRLWKARDRLGGLLVTYPAERSVLDLLGEVNYKMGDLPAAGRYWFLTDREGADVDEALEALRRRYPTPEALGGTLPIRAPLGLFPKTVRDRVEDPLLRHWVNRHAWEPMPKNLEGPYIRPHGSKRSKKPSAGYQAKTSEVAGVMAGVTLAVLLVVSLGVGMVTVFVWSRGGSWSRCWEPA